MNSPTRDLLALIGRILLALMFLLAGFGKVGEFGGTAGYIASKGLPMPAVIAVLTIALEIGAGLALIAGFLTRWAALALFTFTLLANFIFHPFWAAPAEEQMVQNLFFMKNLAVAGGMLLLAAYGPGAWSIDGRKGG